MNITRSEQDDLKADSNEGGDSVYGFEQEEAKKCKGLQRQGSTGSIVWEQRLGTTTATIVMTGAVALDVVSQTARAPFRRLPYTFSSS